MAVEKKSILIIDDEDGALDFIKTYLEDRDYNVMTANNGKDGLSLIIEKKPALVFLDIRMPEMNGIDVLTGKKYEKIGAIPEGATHVITGVILLSANLGAEKLSFGGCPL